MIFSEGRFFVFFAVVFAVFWLLRGNRLRKRWLLLASAVFYGAWDWRFLFLILATITIDFVAALRMPPEASARRRKRWLVASLGGNLAILGFFKYFDFFVHSGEDLLAWFGVAPRLPTLSIVLPVGISFFTFQSMSYTIDVYRGRLRAIRSFPDYALFVAFFPQLVAGPIVRAADFLPQLLSAPRFAEVALRRSLALFGVGFVKKACIADQVAVAVDAVFASPASFGAASKWLAALLYHVQIYCDFSGYTDMAIGAAGLLGYRLTRNFDFPYLARSMQEFWRRWHISLTSWFRDYLYIPLGGNRRGPRRTMLNLAAVFLLCGLWHGAAWTFVLWGAFHGTLLVAERTPLRAAFDRMPAPLRHLHVQLAVVLGWVLFRSPDLGSAGDFLAGMLAPGAAPAAAVGRALPSEWWGVLAVLAVLHVALDRMRPLARVESVPPWLFALAYGAAWALALPWVATQHQPFIYFQF